MNIKNWVNDPLKWSHHPVCVPFSNHVFKIRGKELCRGCTMFYSSFITGFAFSIILGLYQWNAILLGSLMALLLLPLVLAQVVKLPRRIRDMTKAFLGFNAGLGVLAILLHPDLLVKAIIILVAIPMIIIVEQVRSKRDFSITITCMRDIASNR